MRIFMAADTCLEGLGGIETSLRNLKGALEELGHEVLVASLSCGPFPASLFRKDKAVFRSVLIRSIHTQLPIYPVGLEKLILGFSPHVCHVHTVTPVVFPLASLGFETFKICKRLGIPTVYTFHVIDSGIKQYVNLGFVDYIRKLHLRAHLKLVRAFADAMVVPTEFVRRKFLEATRIDENELDVVPTGIDIGRFVPKIRNWDGRRPLTLLYLGRVEKEKNIDTLVEAFLILAQKGANVKLEIWGPGGHRKAVAKRLSKYIARRQVLLGGSVPYDRVPETMLRGDLFVFPGTTDTQALVVVEAMASGAVPIVIRETAASEVCGSAGIAVENAPESIANEVLKLTPERLKNLSKRAVERAKLFSLETFARRMEAVYKKAVEAKKLKKL